MELFGQTVTDRILLCFCLCVCVSVPGQFVLAYLYIHSTVPISTVFIQRTGWRGVATCSKANGCPVDWAAQQHQGPQLTCLLEVVLFSSRLSFVERIETSG